jgi:hypothetical protein
MTISFYPLLPTWAILTLLTLSAGACVYAYQHRNPAVAPWQHTLLLVLRMLSLALVTLMLLCPGHMIEDRNLEKSHIVFLVDSSSSMSTQDLPNRQSRLEKAVTFLQQNRFKRLADYPLAYYTFNSQTLRQTGVNDLGTVKPEGGTDFKQAFARIDKDIGLNRTAAIALLTDGIDFSGFKGSEIAVPVMSVQVGTDLANVKDLGIEPFKCPGKVNEGEELTLEIPLLMQGYPSAMNVQLRVLVDRLPAHTATLSLSSGRTHTETVKTTLAKAGIHVIRIECPTLPDEITGLNNQRELVVEAVQAKEEVAAYFPILNNSFRPLLREFSKDEGSVFTAVYRGVRRKFSHARAKDEHALQQRAAEEVRAAQECNLSDSRLAQRLPAHACGVSCAGTIRGPRGDVDLFGRLRLVRKTAGGFALAPPASCGDSRGLVSGCSLSGGSRAFCHRRLCRTDSADHRRQWHSVRSGHSGYQSGQRRQSERQGSAVG